MNAKQALDRVEELIRNQAKVAPVGSMEWRAHMADIAHVNVVRKELEK